VFKGSIVDNPAFEPLLASLKDGEWIKRRGAAEVLIKLYKSDQLSKTQRSRLLAQRGIIDASHNDGTEHNDRNTNSDCTHSDADLHTDSGIGIAFPV
jgi:hypothetical protein